MIILRFKQLCLLMFIDMLFDYVLLRSIREVHACDPS